MANGWNTTFQSLNHTDSELQYLANSAAAPNPPAVVSIPSKRAYFVPHYRSTTVVNQISQSRIWIFHRARRTSLFQETLALVRECFSILCAGSIRSEHTPNRVLVAQRHHSNHRGFRGTRQQPHTATASHDVDRLCNSAGEIAPTTVSTSVSSPSSARIVKLTYSSCSIHSPPAIHALA